MSEIISVAMELSNKPWGCTILIDLKPNVTKLPSGMTAIRIKRKTDKQPVWKTVHEYEVGSFDDLTVTLEDRNTIAGEHYTYAAIPVVNSRETVGSTGEITANFTGWYLADKTAEYEVGLNVTCSKKKNVSGVVLVNQAMAYEQKDKRLKISKTFIDSAFHHMLRNLRRHNEIPKELIEGISIERENMNNANTIQELMGAEGRGRKKYYEAFNYFLKNDFHFNNRQKRPPTDPINALISFGNSMMYTTTLGEIYKTQLDPTISYLHEPSIKRFSLSLDISEIFKPLIVDSVIFTLINKNIITKKDFNIKEGICYLNDDGKRKFIREYENKLATTIKHRYLNRKVSYRTLIKLECYKLIKCVVEDEEYKSLKAWW